MTLQQLKKEMDKLKESINSRTSQPDILKIKEELKAKIDQIDERLRENGETHTFSAAEAEELIKKIRESCEERVKDPYFQQWVRGV